MSKFAKREKFMDSIVTKSPKGVACWVHIKEPDTYENQSKYKITLKLPKEGAPNQGEIDKFVEQVETFRQAVLKKAGKGFPEGSNPVKDGDEREWKGEGDNPYAGFHLLTFTSKYQPKKIVDVRGQPTDAFPSGGDMCRIGVELFPYAAKARGIGAGVSLRLLGVQIIEKRAQGFDGFADESDDADLPSPFDTDDNGSGPDL